LYPYTADLLCLDFCRPASGVAWPPLSEVSTPLKLPAWEAALQAHPDKAFARFVITGIRDGFRIGFSRKISLQCAPRNMPSATEHPEVVTEYLIREHSLGRMLGPFQWKVSETLPECHINRIRVIPKGHNTWKWRVITDLSFPPDTRVNDGIDPELCSLSYTSM